MQLANPHSYEVMFEKMSSLIRTQREIIYTRAETNNFNNKV